MQTCVRTESRLPQRRAARRLESMPWAWVALVHTVGRKASIAARRAAIGAAAELATLRHARRRLRCRTAARLSALQRLLLLHDRLHRRRLHLPGQKVSQSPALAARGFPRHPRIGSWVSAQCLLFSIAPEGGPSRDSCSCCASSPASSHGASQDATPHCRQPSYCAQHCVKAIKRLRVCTLAITQVHTCRSVDGVGEKAPVCSGGDGG